eukprot:498725-Pyramimonas_sp.AAC.1
MCGGLGCIGTESCHRIGLAPPGCATTPIGHAGIGPRLIVGMPASNRARQESTSSRVGRIETGPASCR